MPLGVIINSSSLIIGGFLGFLIKDRLPTHIRTALPVIFGVISMAMGVTSLQKLNSLPVVVLAVVSGTVLGESLKLESLLSSFIKKLTERIRLSNDDPAYMETLVGIIVLFCASGTGIFGALESGLLGDHTILITKSILDFFTSMTFGAVLGGIVCLIAIPQFAIFLIIFYSSKWIMPNTTPQMIQDFIACGGIIMLATGLRIGQIKHISIVNMLPALIIVMPISHLWNVIVLG